MKKEKEKKNIHASYFPLFTTILQHNSTAICFPSLSNDDPVAYTCRQREKEIEFSIPDDKRSDIMMENGAKSIY